MPIPSNFKEQVQLVTYLVKKFDKEGVEIIKAVKLIVLADIYALRHYGTTLSKDVHYAMKNGTVASNIANIIEQSDEFLGDPEYLKYVGDFLSRKPGNTWSKVWAKQDADDDYLSERDMEVLDMIFDEYKNCTPAELVEKAHQYNAWKKHEKTLSSGDEKRVRVDERDFFKNDGDLAAPKEVIALSEKFYGTV